MWYSRIDRSIRFMPWYHLASASKRKNQMQRRSTLEVVIRSQLVIGPVVVLARVFIAFVSRHP
jgi:hypothetical protein